jgi:DNA-binding NarL/FixJ family response regulator
MVGQHGTDPEHRVMVVDDHDLVRRGVRALIETLPGFALCGEAATAEEARTLAPEAQPDIVVLDLKLPDGDGLELIREFKAAPRPVEVLILTMRDSERVMADAVRAGARGYVLKSEPGERIAEALVALAAHKSYLSPAVSQILLEPRIFNNHGSTKPLTNREREIVRLVAYGKSNKNIAAMLNISVKTVESHRTAAMHKIGAKTAADVVRYALRNDLI